MIEIELCFQGGGAKLASLIAIADAAYNDLPKHAVEVESVSGTSAGAIAAAILATGKDPAAFRARLKEIAPTYLKRLSRKKYLRLIRPILGLPYASRGFIQDFLEDLFTIEGKQYKYVSDLKLPLEIFCTDIVEKNQSKRAIVLVKFFPKFSRTAHPSHFFSMVTSPDQIWSRRFD
uniref:patatin-like phospholipase family protein n=1 Tax=Neorhizobium sp. EC2-8 TaxID=3129230 RepID=UPI0031017072